MLTAATVDEYIKRYPAKVQAIMQKLRKTIKAATPKAEEVISYGIPGYKYHGMLIFFAAWKDHISVYPAPRGHEAFKKALAKYKGGKGTIQIPLDEAMPYDLITKITKFRAKENEAHFAAKNKKKAAKKVAVKKRAISNKQ